MSPVRRHPKPLFLAGVVSLVAIGATAAGVFSAEPPGIAALDSGGPPADAAAIRQGAPRDSVLAREIADEKNGRWYVASGQDGEDGQVCFYSTGVRGGGGQCTDRAGIDSAPLFQLMASRRGRGGFALVVLVSDDVVAVRASGIEVKPQNNVAYLNPVPIAEPEFVMEFEDGRTTRISVRKYLGLDSTNGGQERTKGTSPSGLLGG